MAYKIVERVGDNQIVAICDAASDIAAIGSCDGHGEAYCAGSIAYVATSTPEVHMLNASGSWVKVK